MVKRPANVPFDPLEGIEHFSGIAMGAAYTVPDFGPNGRALNGQEYINKALDSDVYGGRKITYFNKYDRLQQLEQINSRLGIGLIKLGFKLRGPEFKLFCDQAAGLTNEQQTSILQDANNFTTNLDLQNQFAAAGRLLARDGTVPVLNSADARFGNGEGITTLDYMPMSHTTILPIDAEPMTSFQNEEQLWEYGTLTGEAYQVIINERIQAKREIHLIPNGRVTLMRLMHFGNQVRDIYNRNTIGLYGISLAEMIDPRVKQLEDMMWGFSKAINRYGYGRLQIDNDLLKQQIVEGTVNLKQAAKIMATEQKIMNTLEPNRDLLTIGKTVKAIPGGFENASGVIEMIEAVQNDISYGLFETEAGGNRTHSGSNRASSQVSDQDANRVLEALRLQVKVGFESIIKRHLELLGYNEVEAQSIRIELQPIDTPIADLQVLLNIAAMDPKALSMGQAIEMAGLHIPPRQTVDFEEDQTIQSDDQNPPAVALPPGKGASVMMFGAKINVRSGESIQAAFKRKTKQELSAAVKKWKGDNKKIPLPASKTGEWRLIFGRYINLKEGEDEAACYLTQTRRNYDDDAEAWEQESRRVKEEKLKEGKS